MKRPCFTLVELLAVIAVIALLVALSIPVLRSSRQRANALLCASNIKQLTVGLFMYETENQTFPYGFYDTFKDALNGTFDLPPGGYAGGPSYDRMGWWWFHFIEDFCKKSDGKKTVVCCPSRQLSNPKLENNVLCGNYGVNRAVCKSSDGSQRDREDFVGTPLRGSDIPHPGQTLLIVDSGYSIISWWHVTDVPPVSLGTSIEDAAYVPGLAINKDKNLWPGQEPDAINGRHPRKTVNVGYADGHANPTQAANLLIEKTDDGYQNRVPLWLPK